MAINLSENAPFVLTAQFISSVYEYDNTQSESENISILYNVSSHSAAEHLSESWWNIFDERYFRHSWNWTLTLIVTYMLILVIGVIGNCMVILVVMLRPRMRLVTNIFITNLAVADLFVIVFCVCPTLLANIFQPWILGRFMCKGVAYVQGVSVCASAYSLAVISLDRCQAIYGAFHRPHGLSKSEALRIICLIWIIALSITVPWAVIFDVIASEDDGFSYCVETWNNEYYGKIYFLIANLMFCYGLPLVLISVSNGIIWCHVSHRKVPQNTASEGTIKQMHKRARHGVVKMLGIVTLTFLLSWLPLYIIVSRYKFAETMSDWEYNILDLLYPFAQWLGSSNSCVNPVLYAFLNKKFREMFISILPKWFPFVKKFTDRRRMQLARYGVTISNGNCAGSFQSHSCTTLCNRRSAYGRNNNNFAPNRHLKTLHRQETLIISKYQESCGSIVTSKSPAVKAVTPFDKRLKEEVYKNGVVIFNCTSTSSATANV